MEIRQVYCIFFDKYGRILLRIENDKYKLTGGKPEKNDVGYYDTLRRELLEEVNCTVGDLRMVGYQKVEEEGMPAYAQIRMTGIIKEISEAKPDSDRPTWVYDRKFVSPLAATVLLNWGQVGVNQIYDAVIEAQTYFNVEIIAGDMLINKETKQSH